MSRPFTAMYSAGRCGICDEPIEEGNLVAYEDDELCHQECIEEESLS